VSYWKISVYNEEGGENSFVVPVVWLLFITHLSYNLSEMFSLLYRNLVIQQGWQPDFNFRFLMSIGNSNKVF
jgi:hypothetical protein